jgi:hypothetical protein
MKKPEAVMPLVKWQERKKTFDDVLWSFEPLKIDVLVAVQELSHPLGRVLESDARASLVRQANRRGSGCGCGKAQLSMWMASSPKNSRLNFASATGRRTSDAFTAGDFQA